MKKQYLGLGKTKYSSSICLIDLDQSVEMLLTERLNRKKNSGAWPELPLKSISTKLDRSNLTIAENRDVHHPMQIEDIQNGIFPFYDYLKKENLDFFTSRFNPHIAFISHHFCHASAALAISPFEKAVIVVMDGAGTEVDAEEYEECSVFLQDGVKLTPSFRQTIRFSKSHKHSEHSFGNRIGSAYEKASEFIFNSPNSSGKVMGLASFGKALPLKDYYDFMENLPWDLSFKKKSKQDWENTDHTFFKNVAATVQQALEDDYARIIAKVKELHPEYENLILTGGCALNCTNNAKILYQNLFRRIFIPPFPGDECIGFGLAHALKFKEQPESWQPLLFENQSAYFGAQSSVPTDHEIEKHFTPSEFKLEKHQNIITAAAQLLYEGQTIAWFQGRSESGPRALGNRSILSRPDIPGLKDRLNSYVKFRESFRPYGCSALYEKAHLYFDVEEGFNNPYMSYAIKVRPEFKTTLKEVSHVDETSRMQTVRAGQNDRFYKLINEFGQKSGLYCLLNTSLNVMDEPILETVADARRFMEKTPIEYLVIGDFVIKKINN
nr:putative transferase [Bacteriovorax sp. HI3]